MVWFCPVLNYAIPFKKELYEIIAFHTNKTAEEVAKDSDRDFWMSADEAKEYGLVDEVLLINPRKQNKD